jgi:hypothetical protein
MTVALIMDFEGTRSDQYDAVIADMQLGGRMPEHGLYHAAGPWQGGWRVVDAWESDEAFQAFAADQIAPHSRTHGLPEPRMQRLEVTEVRMGASAGQAATFLQVVRMPGLTVDTFHAADEHVRPLPDELVFHVNGPYEGGWFVIDTWLSREARDAFIEHRVRPAFEQVEIGIAPVFEDMDLHATLARAPATA